MISELDKYFNKCRTIHLEPVILNNCKEVIKNMEEQAELKVGLGNIEPEKVSLKPAKVNIVNVSIEQTSKAKKVVFEVKHPDKEEPIKMSSVAYLDGREVKVVGTWYNLDKEGKIQKGSATHVLLTKLGAENIVAAVGKEIDTELDGKYLCFKAY